MNILLRFMIIYYFLVLTQGKDQKQPCFVSSKSKLVGDKQSCSVLPTSRTIPEHTGIFPCPMPAKISPCRCSPSSSSGEPYFSCWWTVTDEQLDVVLQSYFPVKYLDTFSIMENSGITSLSKNPRQLRFKNLEIKSGGLQSISEDFLKDSKVHLKTITIYSSKLQKTPELLNFLVLESIFIKNSDELGNISRIVAPKLKDITLRELGTIIIEPGVLAGAPKLKSFFSFKCTFETLKSGMFAGLKNLQKLSIWYGGIQAVELGVFDGLTSLQNLEIKFNSFVTLEAGLFKDLTSLQNLSLSNSLISSLPVGSFDSLSSLQFLELLGNSINTLTAGIFDGLTSLQYLDLRANGISSIEEGIFDGLTSLQYLNLQLNSISSIEEEVFDDLTNLKELYLNDNPIPNLQPGLLENLSELRLLNVSSNEYIDDIYPGTFNGLSKLEDLYFYNNRYISYIQTGAFNGLSNLRLLELSRNQIYTISNGIFDDLPELRQLILYHNQIDEIEEGTFDKLTKLEVLQLGNNIIKSISASSIPIFSNMSEITLDNNDIEEIVSGAFYSGTESDPGLSVLQLNSGKLTTLDKNTIPLTRLSTTINLSNNSIETISPGAFFILSEPELNSTEINLNYNNLKTIDEMVFGEIMDYINTLHLDGNVLDCDCKVAWLVSNPEYLPKISHDVWCSDETWFLSLWLTGVEACS